MNRRSFLALASGLLVPTPEPVRSYFFAPAGGWRHDDWIEQMRVAWMGPTEPVRSIVLDKDAFEAWLRGRLFELIPNALHISIDPRLDETGPFRATVQCKPTMEQVHLELTVSV